MSRKSYGRLEEMSIAVPIILAIALATSLYGQAGVTWPNYQAEENEKSDKSDNDSSKDMAEKADQKSSEKSKSGKSGKSSHTAASKGRRDTRPRRLE
jgi:hypothetical protein